MDRRSKIIIGIFIAVLLTIMATEIVRPKPINWKPSYTATDKIPYGCHVLFNELETLFPEQQITSVDESLYHVLSTRNPEESSNYLLINNGLDFDKEEYHQMLTYVEEGNSMFIASNYFGSLLADTLNLRMDYTYKVTEDSVSVKLTNTGFDNTEFTYWRAMENRHFISVDSLKTTILGNLTYSEDDIMVEDAGRNITRPNFIRVAFGKGNFYLSTSPAPFSNYYMLNGNQDYVANALSYLEDGSMLYWDNYQKSGRVFVKSPLRYVLDQASLRWAYYLTIAGLIIFVIFRAKREQRIIPVIAPLENSSIEFARTVGTLYHQHKDYSNLIAKKLKFFLEYVRSTFYMDTHTIDDKTAKELAAKSGKSLTETKELVEYIVYLKGKAVHSEDDLIQLNKKITSFKI